MTSALDLLRGGSWRCRSCDLLHEGIFHLGCDAPYHWGRAGVIEPNNALRLDADFLSEDFCVMGGQHSFVRGVLEIPVIGLEDSFGYGCWSTLSSTNFQRYVAEFKANEAGEAWTGWFSSELTAFPGTVNAPCWVAPQPGGRRPSIWLEDEDHPLSIAQRDGITPERLLDIYRQHGHPID